MPCDHEPCPSSSRISRPVQDGQARQLFTRFLRAVARKSVRTEKRLHLRPLPSEELELIPYDRFDAHESSRYDVLFAEIALRFGECSDDLRDTHPVGVERETEVEPRRLEEHDGVLRRAAPAGEDRFGEA